MRAWVRVRDPRLFVEVDDAEQLVAFAESAAFVPSLVGELALIEGTETRGSLSAGVGPSSFLSTCAMTMCAGCAPVMATLVARASKNASCHSAIVAMKAAENG